MFSAAGAGRPGEGVCRGIFSMAGPPAPSVSDAFRWSRGLLSGPLEGLVCPAAWAFPPVLPRGRWAALRAVWKAGLEGGFFALFARRFPVWRGAPETPGGVIFRRTAKKRTCARKVRGGIQLRVVGFTRSALCNERSFRTDVSICTIFSYGSARAGV